MSTKDPVTWKEVKKKWLKFILEQYLSRNDATTQSSSSIKIQDFKTARTDAGRGFQSDLITLNIKAEVIKNGGNPSTVDYTYIVKFLPEEPYFKEAVKVLHGHMKEHLMYSQVIKNLNEFQASFVDGQCRINTPELIYGNCTEKGFVLVMENLKEKGYETVEKSKGLDAPCISAAIDQLSQLHAVSYVYNKERDLLKDNPLLKFDAKKFLSLPFMSDFLIDTYVALLKSKGKYDSATRLEEAKATIIQRGIITDNFHNETVAPKCLIHGDFWNDNIMFRYRNDEATGQDKPIDCKMLDWSTSTIGNPVFDLFYLIYSSTTLETRTNHLHAFMKQYHKNFLRITTELGSAPLDWSFDDFQEEWQRLYPNCVLLILALVTLTHSREYPKLFQHRRAASLDRPLLKPLRKYAFYINSKIAKRLVPWHYTESGMKKMAQFIPKQYARVKMEILSGENESLTDRIFDLLCEADEKGIFRHSLEKPFS